MQQGIAVVSLKSLQNHHSVVVVLGTFENVEEALKGHNNRIFIVFPLQQLHQSSNYLGRHVELLNIFTNTILAQKSEDSQDLSPHIHFIHKQHL